MFDRMSLPGRFRRRRKAWWPAELALVKGGGQAALEFAHGCRGRLALGLSPALLPDGGGSRQAQVAGGRDPRAIVRAVLGLILALHLFWIGTTSLLVLSYKFIQPSATVLMAWRAWADGWKIRPARPLPLKTIPVWLRSMLISVEDYKFYEHHGFDFEAIKRAYEIDKRLDRPMYGGSTLTMQVARTLFLVPAKSYLRKYLEVLVTVELEAILGKDRILELYFGYAEWGKGLFGVEATTRRWYDKGVRGLSRDEGARLVAILSSPIKYRPDWFGRSLILQERYDFLARRYLPSLEPAAPGDAAAVAGQGGGATSGAGSPGVSAPGATTPEQALPAGTQSLQSPASELSPLPAPSPSTLTSP
ncbi:MAG TPA: transglycosylase domain-containing protein [Rectinemataceae bacterium]|nr:transglycosylase domain-containing protein [Rectinemataceae bacterium]